MKEEETWDFVPLLACMRSVQVDNSYSEAIRGDSEAHYTAQSRSII